MSSKADFTAESHMVYHIFSIPKFSKSQISIQKGLEKTVVLFDGWFGIRFLCKLSVRKSISCPSWWAYESLSCGLRHHNITSGKPHFQGQVQSEFFVPHTLLVSNLPLRNKNRLKRQLRDHERRCRVYSYTSFFSKSDK